MREIILTTLGCPQHTFLRESQYISLHASCAALPFQPSSLKHGWIFIPAAPTAQLKYNEHPCPTPVPAQCVSIIVVSASRSICGGCCCCGYLCQHKGASTRMHMHVHTTQYLFRISRVAKALRHADERASCRNFQSVSDHHHHHCIESLQVLFGAVPPFLARVYQPILDHSRIGLSLQLVCAVANPCSCQTSSKFNANVSI